MKPYRLAKVRGRWGVQRLAGDDYETVESFGDYMNAVAGLNALASGPAPLKAGDIFCWSWGYDQTNIDFFEVISVSASGKTVKVRELEQAKSYRPNTMTGDTLPKRGCYKDAAVTKKPYIYGAYGVPRWQLSMEFGCARLWEGKPESYSTYA